MLDFDLASLYEVETKYLKRQVRRNIDRFPADFFFEMTSDEFLNLRSQFGTSSWGGSRYPPMAFTEQGVAMLSGIVNSKKAVAMNIAIMRAFIMLRQVAIQHYDLAAHLNELRTRLGEHDVQLATIYDTIETLLDKKVAEEEKLEAWKNRNRIGFKGVA